MKSFDGTRETGLHYLWLDLDYLPKRQSKENIIITMLKKSLLFMVLL